MYCIEKAGMYTQEEMEAGGSGSDETAMSAARKDKACAHVTGTDSGSCLPH